MEEKLIKDAQYRKGLSIAYFNSVNAAIELANVMFPDMEHVDVKEFIKEYRDWFLEEHKNYYATTIAKVGVNYDAKSAVEKLKTVKSLAQLHSVWLMFSEDERRDDEIGRIAQEIKQRYEKN